MAAKIFIGNYKGGVGKTISTYYLAHYFAKKVGKVLLIDLDPQCSLSDVCMKSVDGQSLFDSSLDDECLNYVFDVYQLSKKYPNIGFSMKKENLIKNCRKNHKNVDFIPAKLNYRNGGLDELAIRLTGNQGDISNLLILQQFIRDNELDEDYELILFDCPPSNNIITQSAFLLSDYYLIPTIMDSLSVKGVDHYINTIDGIYKRYCEDHSDAHFIRMLFGKKPELLGVFETMRKGPSHVREDGLRAEADYKIYNTIIKDINEIADSLSTGVITSGYLYYDNLADEIIADL